MTAEKKVRGPRKKSPRNLKDGSKPAVSHALKELWKTPEFREKMRVRNEARSADRKLNPWKYTRAGVPDGMRKRDAIPLWERAQTLADRFVQIMKDVGELPNEVVVVTVGDKQHEVNVPTNDTGKAEAALREAFVLAVGPSTQQIKIQAINTVLNFTKSKPESKSKLTLNKAEDFLDEVAKSMSGDGAK